MARYSGFEASNSALGIPPQKNDIRKRGNYPLIRAWCPHNCVDCSLASLAAVLYLHRWKQWMFLLNSHPDLNRFIQESGWMRAMIIGWQTIPFNATLLPLLPLYLVFSHQFNTGTTGASPCHWPPPWNSSGWFTLPSKSFGNSHLLPSCTCRTV